jgi:hypothetical protein
MEFPVRMNRALVGLAPALLLLAGCGHDGGYVPIDPVPTVLRDPPAARPALAAPASPLAVESPAFRSEHPAAPATPLRMDSPHPADDSHPR